MKTYEEFTTNEIIDPFTAVVAATGAGLVLWTVDKLRGAVKNFKGKRLAVKQERELLSALGKYFPDILTRARYETVVADAPNGAREEMRVVLNNFIASRYLIQRGGFLSINPRHPDVRNQLKRMGRSSANFNL